jgi:gliding motility-associated-like protein
MLRFAVLYIVFSVISAVSFAQPRFQHNRGQWERNTQYRVDFPAGQLHLSSKGFTYHFFDPQYLASVHKQRFDPSARVGVPRTDVMNVVFEGANKNVIIEGSTPSDEKYNYFLGNDPSHWQTNVSAFGEIWYRNLYDGIDLHLYSYGNYLKYEFLVKAGANPAQIKMRYEGATNLKVEHGNLIAQVPLATVKELKPYCFQKIANEEKEIEGNFQLQNNVASFNFPKGYDATKPLVIDPVLVFSTFSGMTADNWGQTATYGLDGSLYSGGTANFTVKANGNAEAGAWDLAILKFSPDGKKLKFISIIGGKGTDVPHSMIVNSKDELLILGTTSSLDFPVTKNGYDTTFNAGKNVTAVVGMDYVNGSDMFVLKLSPNGDAILGSTYLGGSDNDGLNFTRNNTTLRNYGDEYRGEIVVDDKDNVFIASATLSTDFPLVKASKSILGGKSDAILAKFSPDLSQLNWSTYLGGTKFDAAYSLKVNTDGDVYVCGLTNSADLLPLPNTALKATMEGVEDGFLVKYNGKDYTPIANTYLGTDGADAAQLLDLDASSNPHVIGLTTGKYSVTTGTYTNANSGQFIHALDKDLKQTVFSTVIGTGQGVPDIVPTAFLVNECGNIYLAGWGGQINSYITSTYGAKSTTTGLPITSDAYRSTTNGNNFYLAMLEKGAKSLLYATFFGGSGNVEGDHVDGGTCRFDKKGYVYHAACSCNRTNAPANFTTTPEAWSRKNPSPNCNNAAFKFSIDTLAVSFDTYKDTLKNVLSGCAPLTLKFLNTSVGAKLVEWNIANGASTSTATAGTSYTFNKEGIYTVTLKGSNPLACNKVASAQQTIKVFNTSFAISPNVKICTGQSVQLTASGGNKYEWTPADGLTQTTVAMPTVSPKNNTQYTVKISDAAGCTGQLTTSVSIDVSFQPDFTFEKSIECGKPVSIQLQNKNLTADKYLWIMGNGDTLRSAQPEAYTYKQDGKYTITLKAYKGACTLSTTKTIEIEKPLLVANVLTPNGDGKNDVLEIGNVKGVQLEIFDRWGKQHFQSIDYQNNWGTDVKQGTYFYLITTPTGKQCKGWIEVL